MKTQKACVIYIHKECLTDTQTETNTYIPCTNMQYGGRNKKEQTLAKTNHLQSINEETNNNKSSQRQTIYSVERQNETRTSTDTNLYHLQPRRKFSSTC